MIRSFLVFLNSDSTLTRGGKFFGGKGVGGEVPRKIFFC